MQRSASHSSIDSPDLEPETVFNVVIAYEDFETGKHGKETYDYLVSNLGHKCRFANQMWKFDVLSIPKLRQMAAKDALIADIIIISCHGTHDLSSEVKSWIDSWTYDETNAIALVALLGETGAYSDNQIRSYLADAAKRARIEFFAQPNPLPRNLLDEPFVSDRGTRRDARALSALAGIIERDQSFPHWGINE